MRIRSIKPEFWRSDDVAALSIEDRLLFIGLWSYVDDSGIGVDKVAHICADLFAPDLEANPPGVFARVAGGLKNLSARGLILRYEVDGRAYLYVTNWDKHQRIDKPSKRRYPTPDQGVLPVPGTLPEPSRSTPEKVAPGAGEQGNRGTGEQGNSKPAPKGGESAAFDRFWSAYPRKEAKIKARQIWDRLVKTTDPEEIIGGCERYAALCKAERTEKRFIKSPDGWLNAGRWEDEIEIPNTTHPPQVGSHESWMIPRKAG